MRVRTDATRLVESHDKRSPATAQLHHVSNSGPDLQTDYELAVGRYSGINGSSSNIASQKIRASPGTKRVPIDGLHVLGRRSWEIDTDTGAFFKREGLKAAMIVRQIVRLDTDALATLMSGALNEAALMCSKSSLRYCARVLDDADGAGRRHYFANVFPLISDGQTMLDPFRMTTRQ